MTDFKLQKIVMQTDSPEHRIEDITANDMDQIREIMDRHITKSLLYHTLGVDPATQDRINHAEQVRRVYERSVRDEYCRWAGKSAESSDAYYGPKIHRTANIYEEAEDGRWYPTNVIDGIIVTPPIGLLPEGTPDEGPERDTGR